MGSTRAAFLAEGSVAATAAAVRTRATAIKVTGSDGSTPYSRFDITLVAATAPATPIAAPSTDSTNPRRITSIWMPLERSAERNADSQFLPAAARELCHDTVHADECQHQTSRGKREYERHHETPLGERGVANLRHSANAADRDTRSSPTLCDSRTVGTIETGSPLVRISRVRGPFSSCLTGAKNSARDGASSPCCRSLPTTPTIVRQIRRGVWIAVEGDALSDRVVVCEVLSCERFIDEHDRLSTTGIGVGEGSSLEDRHLQQLVVSG